MNSIAKITLSFIGGVAAGLTTGYLTAPRSGKKTREKIANEIDSTRSSLEEAANKKLEEAKDILNQTLDTYAKQSKNGIDKTKKVLTQ